MAGPAIDTLDFAQKLKQAGIPDKQAEDISSALGDGLSGNLASKSDLRLVQWMLGFNLALSAAILWRIVSHFIEHP